MTIKTREPDDRFKAQVPDFKLEKRDRRKYRTWRDDPDAEGTAPEAKAEPETPSKPIAEEEASRLKPLAEPQAIGEQTDSKPIAIGKQTPSNQSFTSLTGLQRDLILFYYESIQLNGGQNTGPITLERLMDLTT